jgi:hypothetical protein
MLHRIHGTPAPLLPLSTPVVLTDDDEGHKPHRKGRWSAFNLLYVMLIVSVVGFMCLKFWRRGPSWKTPFTERMVKTSSLLAPRADDPRMVRLKEQVAALKTDPLHMVPFKESAGEVVPPLPGSSRG